MAFNFPNSPTEGQIYTDATSGAQYIYRNGVWMQSSAAQIKLSAQTRNRIVNPAMQISQENGNAVGSTNSYYPADQWVMRFSAPPERYWHSAGAGGHAERQQGSLSHCR
jgi:hypothetical protein